MAEKTKWETEGIGGQAAVFGVFLILLFTAYGIVRVMGVAVGSSSISYGMRALEVFYAAETGVEYAIEEIRAGKPDAGNIEGLRVGSALVSVTNRGDTLLTAVARTSEPSLSKTLELAIEVSPIPGAFEYVLYVGNEKNLNLNADLTIRGNILFDGRNLRIGRGSILSNTTIYVPRSASIRSQGGSGFMRHDYMFENESPDDFPRIATAYYTSYVENAYGYPTVGPVIDLPTALEDYTDRVLYREGDLTIRAAVEGPGIVAASGNISLEGNASVGPDIHIIAGGAIAVQNARVTSGAKTGSLLFAFERIALGDGSVLAASVLTPGDLELAGTAVQEGLCYAEGSLSMDGLYDVKGSIVTWNVSKIEGKGTLAFDEDKLDVIDIPGLRGRPGVRRIAWAEDL